MMQQLAQFTPPMVEHFYFTLFPADLIMQLFLRPSQSCTREPEAAATASFVFPCPTSSSSLVVFAFASATLLCTSLGSCNTLTLPLQHHFTLDGAKHRRQRASVEVDIQDLERDAFGGDSLQSIITGGRASCHNARCRFTAWGGGTSKPGASA